MKTCLSLVKNINNTIVGPLQAINPSTFSGPKGSFSTDRNYQSYKL